MDTISLANIEQSPTTYVIPAYEDNPLIEACGPILSPEVVGRNLLCLPVKPSDLRSVPNHVRGHMLASVQQLHIPTQSGIDLGMRVDRVMRQSYVHRSPHQREAWARLYGTHVQNPLALAVPHSLCVVGGSGNGKTTTIYRILNQYPQFVEHPSFPNVIGPMRQMLWLSGEVPPSGKLADLAESLMHKTEIALGEPVFREWLRPTRKQGPQLWDAWLQFARTRFLGTLHIDEIQNLFRLESVKARKKARAQSESIELRVVEDTALKSLIALANEGMCALIISGTADGMEMFGKRFATNQRLVKDGFFKFDRIALEPDPYYKNFLFPQLSHYNFSDHPLEDEKEIRKLLYQLSCGVPRILLGLWRMGHEAMWKRMGDRLHPSDFQCAMQTDFSPLLPALDALRSDDPEKLARFEDLLPKGFNYFPARA